MNNNKLLALLVLFLLILALVCMLLILEQSQTVTLPLARFLFRDDGNENNSNNHQLSRHRRMHNAPSTFWLRHKKPTAINNNNNKETQQQQYRIAIIIPFVGEDAASIPPYFDLFCTAAAGSHELVDFLIIHNGVLESYHHQYSTKASTTKKSSSSSSSFYNNNNNIHFINLGSTEAMAEALLRVLPNDDEEELVMERDKLIKIMTKHLQLYPYVLVEFKPALGFIFQKYLRQSRNDNNNNNYYDYTHWGYADLDMIFGDLPRWITPDELEDYDMVTYGYGDQHRIYVRGQFTFHKLPPNNKDDHDDLLLLWKKCDYLSKLDQRFASVMAGETKLQFESAEGCYSSVILDQTNLKVKYAVKAFTDIDETDTVHTHGLYISLEQDKTIIYKQRMNNQKFKKISPTWYYTSSYASRQQPLQYEVGKRQRINVPWQEPDYNAKQQHIKCMYWAREEYQTKLCLDEKQIPSTNTVFWMDGVLYQQPHEMVTLPVDTAPFFHFQEWKRYYRTSQLATFSRHNPMISTFLLTKEGVIPIITSSQRDNNNYYYYYLAAQSPPNNNNNEKLNRYYNLPSLGFFHRHGRNDDLLLRSNLPRQRYCLQSAPRKFPPVPPAPECLFVVSWQDETAVKILSTAPDWKHYVDMDRDVTLTMTLQVSASQANTADVLKGMLDLAVANIRRWQGQPCVLLLDVAGSELQVLETLQTHLSLSLGDSGSLETCLVAAIYRKDDGVVSRKALMNMAQDVAPTRWTVSGMEMERGMVMASDACYFVHEMARAYHDTSSNVFFIPQFALKAGGEYDTALSLHGLLESKHQNLLTEPAKLEKGQCDEDDNKMIDSLAPATQLWWDSVQELVAGPSSLESKSIPDRALALETLEVSLMRLLTSTAQYQVFAMDLSPILLIDNHGPYPGLHTSELVREVEEFGGKQCYNGLKLAQLVTFGYHLNVVSGAFAASTVASRQVAFAGGSSDNTKDNVPGSSRCDGCFMFDSEHDAIVEAIARDERQRPAKAAILWDELSAISSTTEL